MIVFRREWLLILSIDPALKHLVSGLDCRTQSKQSNTSRWACADIKKPFNSVDNCTEITYRKQAAGHLEHVAKGTSGIFIKLFMNNKTEELKNCLEPMLRGWLLGSLCVDCCLRRG